MLNVGRGTYALALESIFTPLGLRLWGHVAVAPKVGTALNCSKNRCGGDEKVGLELHGGCTDGGVTAAEFVY